VGVNVSMLPKKHIPNFERVLLEEMWADLVGADPTLAQSLQVPISERLAGISKRVVDWIGKGLRAEGPMYPWM
jgi:hypothetical protein